MSTVTPHCGFSPMHGIYTSRRALAHSLDDQKRRLIRSDEQLQNDVNAFVSTMMPRSHKRPLENSDNCANPLKLMRSIRDQSGLVANIFSKRATLETYIKIVFKGLELGAIAIGEPLKEVWLTNGHLFGMGVDNKSPKAPLVIFEWDEAGMLIRRFDVPELGNFSQGLPKWTLATSENYLAIVIGKDQKSGQSSKILILDFIEKKSRIFDLDSSSDQVDIGYAIIHRNHLIIGSSVTNIDEKGEVAEFNIPKITVFNLFSKKIENVYNTRPLFGNITHIVARNMQIYFITHLDGKDVCVWSLNRSNGEQTELLELPDMERVDGSLQLFIADEHLIISNANTNGRANSMVFTRYEIKLD